MDITILIHADHLFDLLFDVGLDLRIDHQTENTHDPGGLSGIASYDINYACRAF